MSVLRALRGFLASWREMHVGASLAPPPAPPAAPQSPKVEAPAGAPSDLFERAVAVILGHEGGLSDHPADPGGLTRFGISKRAYPDIDIPNLTVAGAKAIYRRDYWDKLRCGEMPWPVALAVFDAGVNQGVGFAARTLQSVLQVKPDGAIGPETLGALRQADPVPTMQEFQVRRLRHYVALPGWGTFGFGWTRRVLDVTVRAVG